MKASNKAGADTSRGSNSRARYLVLAVGPVLIGALVLGTTLQSKSVRSEHQGHEASLAGEKTINAPVLTRTAVRIPEGLQVPSGMAYVPGGRTTIGSEEGNPDESPTFAVRVKPFFMDKHPVTVAQFREFVRATRYVTEAERFGDAGMFDPATREWRLVSGATWHHPLGPEASPAPDDHPATQVSWNDAVAYARRAGKRLPTEVEWEHAARGGRDRRERYSWGNERVDEHGRHRANTWNGSFPLHDSGADGYTASTSPVGAFGETELGLADMGGNVWEWTGDWYRPYGERSAPFSPSQGSERAQRGGSYLCSPNYCHGFRVSARSHSTPESALAHVGFRTVKGIPPR